MNTAEELKARLQIMKGLRGNFDTQWQEVKNLIWPDGGDFNRTRSAGEKTNLEIFDMTAALALEQSAALHESLSTPRTQRWHRLVPTNAKLRESVRVKEWFEAATDVLFGFRNSPRAKFYNAIHEDWKSTLAYGNGNIYVEELKTGGIAYRYTHVGSCWIDVDPNGNIDTIFYEYPLTARASVKRWGDGAPGVAKDAMSSNPHTEHRYLHAVFPNDDHDPDSLASDKRAFVAYEVCLDSCQIMETGSYHELPYMWSRYTVNPAEMYGRGPAMLILPDLKTLQEMEKVFLRSGQKVADPPLLVADDGKLGRGDRRIKLGAGKLTMGGVDANGRPMVMPLHTGARLDITLEMANQRRDLIRRAFSLDLVDILLQDRPDMTATEVIERAREKGLLVAPIVGRHQSEKLGPMIEREIRIAQRQRKLPPLPPELVEARGEYEIEYESDATRMQKSSEVSAFTKTFEALGPFFESNPSLLSVFKQDEAIRASFETLGGSSRLLNTPDEYGEIQAAHARAEEEAQMAANVPVAAKGVRDLAAAKKDLAA